MSSDSESDHFLKDEERRPSSSGHFLPRCIASKRSWIANDFYGKQLRTYWLPPLVFLVTSLLWGAILLYVLRQPRFYQWSGKYGEHNKILGMPVSGYKFLKCGTSIQEARSLGCEYDILANHWIPKPCMDREAVKEYQSDGTWYGFAHENRTELVALEAMGHRSHYYTSERDRIVHCAMLWRKQYRAFTEGRKELDSITVSPEQTHHCSQYLMDITDSVKDPRHQPLRVDVGFAGCFLRD